MYKILLSLSPPKEYPASPATPGEDSCRISGIVQEVVAHKQHPDLNNYPPLYILVLDDGRALRFDQFSGYHSCSWQPCEKADVPKNFPQIGDQFTALIKGNYFWMNEENMKKYPEVEECNIAVVQKGSQSIFNSIQTQKDAVGTKPATVKITLFTPETETTKAKEEQQEIPACFLEGMIVDVQPRAEVGHYNVILDNGTVVYGQKEDASGKTQNPPLLHSFRNDLKIGQFFSGVISEDNAYLASGYYYPHIPDCNLQTVQSQSKKILPHIKPVNTTQKALPTPKNIQFADHCQLNDTIVMTKTSIHKNKKSLTTAFIFQNEDAELTTAREILSFPTAKDTTIQKAFEKYYGSLHGKKMHVILDRGNKNTIVSEYNATHKSLPWCGTIPSIPQNSPEKKEPITNSPVKDASQEQHIFPIGFSGNIGGGGMFFVLTSLLWLVILAIFMNRVKKFAFKKV